MAGSAMNGICDLPNLNRLKSMGVTFSNAFSNRVWPRIKAGAPCPTNLVSGHRQVGEQDVMVSVAAGNHAEAGIVCRAH